MGWVQGPGYESDAARAVSQQQVESAREQPQQFQMEQQGFQLQQRQAKAAAQQAEMLNQMMKRQMDPQMRLYTANLVTGMINASKDPMIRARLQAYQGLMLNGQITPENMMEQLGKMDEYKVLLEQAKAAQSYGAAALTGTQEELNKKITNMLPSGPGAGPTASPSPSGSSGIPAGVHVEDMTGPDGTTRKALFNGSKFIGFL